MLHQSIYHQVHIFMYSFFLKFIDQCKLAFFKKKFLNYTQITLQGRKLTLEILLLTKLKCLSAIQISKIICSILFLLLPPSGSSIGSLPLSDHRPSLFLTASHRHTKGNRKHPLLSLSHLLTQTHKGDHFGVQGQRLIRY